jgi:hypothetical protein
LPPAFHRRRTRRRAGWKRLLAWRADLSHAIGSPEAKHEYRKFSREIDAIPAGDRLNHVLKDLGSQAKAR